MAKDYDVSTKTVNPDQYSTYAERDVTKTNVNWADVASGPYYDPERDSRREGDS